MANFISIGVVKNVLKRCLRYLSTGVFVILILLTIFVILSIAPIDQTPAHHYPSYKHMMSKLEMLDSIEVPHLTNSFIIGFAKTNLTPAVPIAMGGYGNRRGKSYTSIRDSIYIRAIVVNNGAQDVAIVSADLLMIPPSVTKSLELKLTEIGFSLNNTYLGATHTHNSIGGWGEGAAQIFYGTYQDSIVEFIGDKIVECIRLARSNMKPSTLKAGAIPIPQAVRNRLVKGGPEDTSLRIVEIHRNDSTKLLLMSYTAHATCLYSKDLSLSRDYPGKLVDTMEAKGYFFAMFMAGAVGSHTCSPPQGEQNCIDWMAEEISKTFLANRDCLLAEDDASLLMLRVPLLLNDPQVKISSKLKVRSWLFRSAMGESPVYLTALRFGRVILLGTPCDFSGEFSQRLDSFVAKRNLSAMVTSFNGGYIGYVSPIYRYDVDHEETQLMNWYAPGTGEYIEESMEKLVQGLEN